MAIVFGTGNSETIDGADGVTNAIDTVFGYGGNDTIYGLGSGDTLHGGDGDDSLYGGTGNDTLNEEMITTSSRAAPAATP